MSKRRRQEVPTTTRLVLKKPNNTIPSGASEGPVKLKISLVLSPKTTTTGNTNNKDDTANNTNTKNITNNADTKNNTNNANSNIKSITNNPISNVNNTNSNTSTNINKTNPDTTVSTTPVVPPVKRRVGRPTKAEALARLAATGIDVDTYLAQKEAEKAARREARSLHAPPTTRTIPTTNGNEEHEAHLRDRQLSLLAAVTDAGFKRRRGRPSKEELRLRSLKGPDGRVDPSVVAEIMNGGGVPGPSAYMLKRYTASTTTTNTGAVGQHRYYQYHQQQILERSPVETAWDPEVRSLLDGSRYGTTTSDQLLPLVLLFNEPTTTTTSTSTTNSPLDDSTLFRHFHSTTTRLDSAMGCTELGVLDQRLCLEEEKFLLSKLQKSITGATGAAAAMATTGTLGISNPLASVSAPEK